MKRVFAVVIVLVLGVGMVALFFAPYLQTTSIPAVQSVQTSSSTSPH